MSAGGTSIIVVAVLALTATALFAWVRRNRFRRQRRAALLAAAAQRRNLPYRIPTSQAGEYASAEADSGASTAAAPGLDGNRQKPAPTYLSLIGTDELAETIGKASLASPKRRRIEGPFPKRFAERNRKRTTWAAGGSLGAGSAWGGGVGCGGGTNGSSCGGGSGCGGGGCGGGGCGGGGS